MTPVARRWLFGCLGGCATVLVLCVGSCIAFVVWLNAPGDVLAPEQLLDPGIRGYGEWRLRLEDPATEEFFLLLMKETQRVPAGLLPPALERTVWALQARQGERKLRRLFPVVLVWTLREAGGEAAEAHLFSASLSGTDHQFRLMDWLIGKLVRPEEGGVVSYRGETVFVLPLPGRREPGALFIHHGDLFFATRLEAARAAVDRLQAPAAPARAPGALDRWLALAPAQPLRGAIDNGRGEIERLWRWPDPGVQEVLAPETWRALEGLTFGGELSSQGTLSGTLELHFGDPRAAGEAAAAFGEALERLTRDTAVELEETSVEGSRLRVRLEVERIGERVRAFFTRSWIESMTPPEREGAPP